MKTTIGFLLLLAAPAAQAEEFFNSTTEVFHTFQVKRSDGKLVTIKDGLSKLKNLPEPDLADRSICVESIESATPEQRSAWGYMPSDVTRVGIAMMREHRTELTAEEVAFLRTVPHCEPFTKLLGLVSMNLAPAGGANSSFVDKVEFTGGKLVLKLGEYEDDRKAKVTFKLAISELKEAKITAAKTGLGIGVQIQEMGSSDGYFSESSGTVRCEESGYRYGRNGYERVSREGTRSYKDESFNYSVKWKFIFTTPDELKLMEIDVTSQKSEDMSTSGSCELDRRRDHGRDYDRDHGRGHGGGGYRKPGDRWGK